MCGNRRLVSYAIIVNRQHASTLWRSGLGSSAGPRPGSGRSTPTLATVRASMRRARARALTNCAACLPGTKSGACSGSRYRAWRGIPWNGFNSSTCVARTMWRSSRTTTCTCRAATMTASSWASEVRCRPPSCRSCGHGWKVDAATRRCAARCTGAWAPALCAKGTPSARTRTSACRHRLQRCSALSGRRARRARPRSCCGTGISACRCEITPAVRSCGVRPPIVGLCGFSRTRPWGAPMPTACVAGADVTRRCSRWRSSGRCCCPNAMKAMSSGRNGSISRNNWRGIILVATAAGASARRPRRAARIGRVRALRLRNGGRLQREGVELCLQRRRPHEPPETRLLFDGWQAPRPGGGAPVPRDGDAGRCRGCGAGGE